MGGPTINDCAAAAADDHASETGVRSATGGPTVDNCGVAAADDDTSEPGVRVGTGEFATNGGKEVDNNASEHGVKVGTDDCVIDEAFAGEAPHGVPKGNVADVGVGMGVWTGGEVCVVGLELEDEQVRASSDGPPELHDCPAAAIFISQLSMIHFEENLPKAPSAKFRNGSQ